MPLKVAIVLGTRPEIIKLSPIIHRLKDCMIPHIVIHTGQHYSYELSEQIFNDLNLDLPDYNLLAGSGHPGEQTGKMLIGIEKILLKEKPDSVIVLGDPNSAFAGALAASKLHIPVCHIEAGRRSGNRFMAEELNRLMIDQIADILFTPNQVTCNNLLGSGVPLSRIIVSGDPIVDAVNENADLARKKSHILETFELESGKYFLATLHRPENVNFRDRLEKIICAFRTVTQKYGFKFIFSVHPKTQMMINEFNIDTSGLILTKPLGYLDFLRLEMDSAVLLTDSGSLQEEACILRTPCVTLRDDTERPETVEIGANYLSGTDTDSITDGVSQMLSVNRNWLNPFGSIGTSGLIINEIQHKSTINK